MSSTTGTGLLDASNTFWSMSCFHLMTCKVRLTTQSSQKFVSQLNHHRHRAKQRAGSRARSSRCRMFVAACSQTQQKRPLPLGNKRASCCYTAPGLQCPTAARTINKAGITLFTLCSAPHNQVGRVLVVHWHAVCGGWHMARQCHLPANEWSCVRPRAAL